MERPMVSEQLMTRRCLFATFAFGFAALPATALAHEPSSSAPAGSSTRPGEEDAPPEVRRLWDELYCMCGECAHETLSYCSCEDAARERRKITDRIKELNASGRQATAYETVLKEYVQRFGEESQVGHYQPKMRFMWREVLTTLGSVLVVGIALYVLVEWARRRMASASGGPSQAGRPQMGVWRSRRKRKS